jgi:hypothetical protein
MSDYVFKKAVREEVGLLIGLIGPSGGGKTYSAMRIASGIVGKGNRFAVIDTEARRALHYAEMFDFDHLEIHAPFRPDTYAKAIKAADDAGYKAIVVDSASHEWAGEGGILDWQEEELTRMAGDDYKKRDACKMAAWIKPKMSHKQMTQKLLQTKAHLILCFRAEEKVKMEKDPQGKMQIVPQGFQPICSKEMPYELTVSFLLLPDKPGIPQPIKLQEQHKAIFPLNRLLDENSGKAVSEWAKGTKNLTPEAEKSIVEHPGEPQVEKQASSEPQKKERTPAQKKLEVLISKDGIDREMVKSYLNEIAWLPIIDDKLSMNNISEKNLKIILDKWESFIKKFSEWVDGKNKV